MRAIGTDVDRTARRAGLVLLLLAAAPIPDPSRREYFTPGLVLDAEGRNAACDVLVFTRDGKHLLAAGDDKVVRNWALTPEGLKPSLLPTLRWPIFREVLG